MVYFRLFLLKRSADLRWLFASLLVYSIFVLGSPRAFPQLPEPSTSSDTSAVFEITVITDQLNYPWGMTLVTNDHMLVTEKDGSIKRVSLSDGRTVEVTGGPRVTRIGQGGLLDVEKHPHFTTNHRVYFSYTKSVAGGVTTAIARAILQGDRLTALEDILITNAVSSGGRHFGSRLAFDTNNQLYVTVGDRGDRARAQQLSSHAGKVLRIDDDGRIPADNPFIHQKNAKPEIYTLGHRNPQGLAYDIATNRLWLHEHGPKGGDEVNLIERGGNYGWPLITYGREYSGRSITDETHREGLEQPLWKWVPSIAPSGLAVYRGNAFEQWKGDLLVGALKYKLMVRLKMKGSSVEKEQRLFSDYGERIRAINVGFGGEIYLLTDSHNGQLIKLMP